MTKSRSKASGPDRGRWSSLLTERRNPRSGGLDTMSTARVVKLLLEDDRRALTATVGQSRTISRAAERAARALDAGGSVVFLGAGTSGRMGVLEAAECPPTFGVDPGRVRAVMAGGEGAVFRAVEGAEDNEENGRQEASALRPPDLLVGISASSVTPFVRGALAAARENGVATVLVTCAPGPGLRRLADTVVAIASGPEVLTGSTRLKAGSATKAALNAITTAAMVRLGKAYDNLMVDMRPTNAKLLDRARRIVSAAGGVSADEAARLLTLAGSEVKTAIVMARRGDSAEAARKRLAAARGHVRKALRR
jgi:N-acetylmuramic acid 6-phosphate etherase